MLQFFRRNKTSHVVIDPANLTDQHARLLKALLNARHSPSELSFGPYSLFNPKTKHTVEIMLIHTLLKKMNKHEGNVHLVEYYVKNNKHFDNGSFGSVSHTLGTLVDHNDGSFSFNKKIRAVKQQLAVEKRKYKVNAFLETTISSLIPHLHVKQIANGDDDQYSHIVMRLLEKQTLGKIIDDKTLLTSISSLRRLTTTLNILRALRDQVHNQGIIHRDVKPDNLMIDEVGNARFIDFGLSRFDSLNDLRELVFLDNHPNLVSHYRIYSKSHTAGSLAYQSPEACKGVENNQHSDVYSLGLLLLEFWGMRSRSESIEFYRDELQFRHRNQLSYKALICRKLTNDSHEPAIHCFESLIKGNLSDDLAHRIYSTLKGLIAFNPVDRLRIEDAIAKFEEIRLEHALSLVRQEDDIAAALQADITASNQIVIRAAYEVATNIRQRLDQLTDHEYFFDYKILKQSFIDEIAKTENVASTRLLNHSQTFTVFKEVLCVNSFTEIENIQKLFDYLDALKKNFWQSFSRVHVLIKDIQHVITLKENLHFSESLKKLAREKLDLLLKDLNHLAAKFQKRKIHIDDLASFNKRSDLTLNEIETKFQTLINPFFHGKAKSVLAYIDRTLSVREKCEQQNEGVQLYALKNPIKQAILHFLDGLDSFHRLLNESTYKLQDRSLIAKPLVDLVMHVDDEQIFTDELTKILHRLEVSSDYGRHLAHGVNKTLREAFKNSHLPRQFKP